MSRAGPVIVFGFFLIVCGLYWSLWNDSTSYLDNFVIENAYYNLIYWVWRMIPAILFVIGLISLIAGGMSIRNSRMVRY